MSMTTSNKGIEKEIILQINLNRSQTHIKYFFKMLLLPHLFELEEISYEFLGIKLVIARVLKPCASVPFLICSTSIMNDSVYLPSPIHQSHPHPFPRPRTHPYGGSSCDHEEAEMLGYYKRNFQMMYFYLFIEACGRLSLSNDIFEFRETTSWRIETCSCFGFCMSCIK